MQLPPEFYEFAQAFYQGSRSEAKNEQEWIASALRHLDDRGKNVVKQFLTDLLSQGSKEAELQKLWNSTGSNYYIVGKEGDEAVRNFLTMVRDQIA
jgi:hypothetical protein